MCRGATRHVHSLRARHVQHPTSTQPAPNQHPTSTQLAARPTLGHPHACTRQWAAAGCWCRCTRVYSVSARAWPRRCRRPRCRAIRSTGTPRCKFQGHPGSRSAMGRLFTTERGYCIVRISIGRVQALSGAVGRPYVPTLRKRHNCNVLAGRSRPHPAVLQHSARPRVIGVARSPRSSARRWRPAAWAP